MLSRCIVSVNQEWISVTPASASVARALAPPPLMPASLSSQCPGKESAGTPPSLHWNSLPSAQLLAQGSAWVRQVSQRRPRPALCSRRRAGAAARTASRYSCLPRIPAAALGMHGHCRPRSGACCSMRAARRLPLPPRAQPSPAQPILTQLILSQPSRAQSLPCGTAGGTRRAWDARAPEGGFRGRRCQVCGWSPGGICGQSWTRPSLPGHSTGPSGSCAMPPSSPRSDSLRYGESSLCVREPVSAAKHLPGGLRWLFLES